MRVKAREAKEWAKALRGVIDTFPTPYTEGEEIDEERVRKLIRYNYELMKSDGVLAIGGASEFWFLTKEERKRYCEVVVDEAEKTRPGAPIIICTLCTSARETVELTRHAAEAGASAVMLRNPLFATDERGVYEFYRYVADNSDIAIVLQNVAGAGGVFYMSPGLIAQMAEEMPAICAIKNLAGGSHSIALKKLAGDNMAVSCFDSYALMSGVISPLGLVNPILLGRQSMLFQTPENLIMRQFCYACIEGDLAQAREIYFNQLTHLTKLYYQEAVIRPNPAGALEYNQAVVKYWATLLGIPVGKPAARAPVSPPTDEIKEKVRVGLLKAGFIKG
ncbi:MAG: dihydrodipicolinate synthase family protein [Chloroflexota bacterium]